MRRGPGPFLAGLALTTLHTHTPTLAGAATLTACSAYALHRANHAHHAHHGVTPRCDHQNGATFDADAPR